MNSWLDLVIATGHRSPPPPGWSRSSPRC
jgi:hypothetical protein